MLRRIFFCFFMLLCTFQLVGQDSNKYQNISWRIYHSPNWRDYVDYQSAEWKNMPIEEKYALLQIPSEELKLMSTDELLEASVDCMFAKGIGRHSKISKYYEEIYNEFNGFRELTARNDLCEKIIEYYGLIDLEQYDSRNEGFSNKEHVQRLEHLIGHPKIIEKFTVVETHQLISLIKAKYSQKVSIKEFSDKDQISTVYALAKLSARKDKETRQQLYKINDIDMFLQTGIFLTKTTRDQIMEITK